MKNLAKLCCGLLVLSACQNENPVAIESSPEASGTLSRILGHSIPVAMLDPPDVVYLRSRPKPQRKGIPQSAGRNKQKSVIVYPSRNYTSDQGLSSNNVEDIIQDAFGNMWFATNTGASKYDGNAFTNYGPQLLVDSSVHNLLVDRSGAIWFGMYPIGIAKFDGRSFTNYATEQGLLGNEILCSVEDKKGFLWFGSQRGLFRFDGENFRRYSTEHGLPNDSVRHLALDKNGDLWIATPAGASRYDGHSFTTYNETFGLPNNSVNAIAVDDDGNVWIGTSNGLSKYDGKRFLRYTSKQGLRANEIKSLALDKRGNLWIVTSLGIDKFDGKTFVAVSDAQALLDSNKITRLFVDDAQNLWVATNGLGVIVLLENGLTFFKRDHGLTGPIIEDRESNYWISGENGIWKYDGMALTKYTAKDGLLADRVHSLYEDESGRIWMSTKKGVSAFDGSGFLNYTAVQGLRSNGENGIIRDKRGSLWFIGREITKFDGTSFTNFGKEQGFEVQGSYLGMLEDRQGNLWFPSPQGVTRYDGKFVTKYGAGREFGSEVVWAIQEDALGNLWFSSDGGLTRYDGATFLRYAEVDGLPSNLVVQVAFIDRDMAIGTSRGLVILKGFKRVSNWDSKSEPLVPPQNALSNAEMLHYRPVFEIYNSSTGYMIGNVFITKDGLHVDHENKLWIMTYEDKSRLLRFDYSAVPRQKAPSILIREVQIDNRKIPWYAIATKNRLFDIQVPKTSGRLIPPNIVEEVTEFGKLLSNQEKEKIFEHFKDLRFTGINGWYSVPIGLELPYNNNTISFTFGAIEPVKADLVAYQYKLEGHDKEWSAVTKSVTATFSNVYEGTYEFKVKARTPSGIWGEPTLYAFKVLPPWYRTWWAYSVYGASALFFLFLLYRWRTAALRKRQRELEDLYHSAERFLPKNFLQILHKERFQDVNLGDSAEVEKQIMFSDIRGFTALTEKLGPQRTALILNKYMGYMAPIVREYDGVVGQFLGDGILAFFEPKPEMAIDAALAMKRTLSSFNRDLAEYGLKPVDIGIGLNLGQAVFSIIGEKERLEGHVISDSVNLSSRVESLNKYYRTSLLITDAVYDKIADPSQYLIRLIDKVIVVGKEKSIKIYEVNELLQDEESKRVLSYYDLFGRAFEIYEKGDFARAEELFIECVKQNPADHVAEILRDRCAYFRASGVPPGWNGTFKMTEK